MAVDYMLVKILKKGVSGQERMEASGLVNGEEAFARSDDRPPAFPEEAGLLAEYYVARTFWILGFISRVLGELGDDDWSLVSNSDLTRVDTDNGPHAFVLSRPR